MKTKNYQVFDFQNVKVNVMDDNGEIWFKAKDVCGAVGIKNTRDAMTRLDADEVKVFNINTVGSTDTITVGNPNINFISESGLYHLLNGSRKPQAKPFQRWVNHEVLPSIRKHGAYMTPETIEKVLADPDFIISLANELKKERQRRIKAESKIEEDFPYTTFGKLIDQSEDTISFKELADLISASLHVHLGRNRLMQDLRKRKHLCSGSANWNLPTAQSIESGLLVESEKPYIRDEKTHLSMCGRVTSKGQNYYLNLYKKSYELTRGIR